MTIQLLKKTTWRKDTGLLDPRKASNNIATGPQLCSSRCHLERVDDAIGPPGLTLSPNTVHIEDDKDGQSFIVTLFSTILHQQDYALPASKK